MGQGFAMTWDTPRRRHDDEPVDACCNLRGTVGDETCEKVLAEVCEANRFGKAITIWDLPRVTGLPLHTAFAAVRTLEFGRLLTISDNPSDPFGATLRTVPIVHQGHDQRQVA